MSMCRVVSCVVGRGFLLWLVHFHSRTLLALALLHFSLQGQSCLLLQVSLDFLLLHSSPLSWKGHLLLVLVLGGLVGHLRTIQLQFFRINVWGIDLDYCDIEWFALEMNSNHLLIYEIAPKYYISDSFTDCVSYSFSSKGFLPTVLDIMVIWIIFRVHHKKYWTGWSTSWNQDCLEN